MRWKKQSLHEMRLAGIRKEIEVITTEDHEEEEKKSPIKKCMTYCNMPGMELGDPVMNPEFSSQTCPDWQPLLDTQTCPEPLSESSSSQTCPEIMEAEPQPGPEVMEAEPQPDPKSQMCPEIMDPQTRPKEAQKYSGKSFEDPTLPAWDNFMDLQSLVDLEENNSDLWVKDCVDKLTSNETELLWNCISEIILEMS
ncbi:uncharacterized protein LOC118180485 [Stegodyphus dumicola]|uniref:uncharacterized protein LOC118180485 n=1 Tax=Stegodyphus dumicola TaxID=202533 RepID=UPI0015AEDEB9|nr:uncharacterized protein LOC118180485 [Stegodyphus dumicola]